MGAAAIAALLLIGPTPTRFEANALAEADQHSGRVLGVVPVGDTPSALTAADGALWVANAGEATVSRVDPKQGRVVRTIALPGTPLGIVSGAGSIWVVNSDIAAAHSSVSRIDPRYARVTATIPLPSSILIGSGAEITWDGRDIWAVTQAGSAFRIDPSSNEVTARIPVGDDPTSLAASAGSIWVASRRAASISRIESPGAVTDTIKVGPVPSSIAAGAGALWVADSGENAVRRLDPRTGSVITTISVGRSPSSVAASGHDVWVGNAGDETVTRIDARTNRVTKTVDVGFPPASITIADGRVWIALQQATPAVTAAGGVARVLTSIPGAIDSVDPPLAYTTISWQIEYATCAKLVNYPDAFARRGFRLQPEIARSMPTVSDGGRTYTFTIRKGFRFSPPSNQEVTARTFKYSIERALAPGTKSFAVTFFPDIVGVRAYETGHASHISGVRALGDRLVIRLQEPAGDLPARLAMPFFCPVPIGTPVDFKGLAGVPSAGPYYVAAYSPNKDLVLRRNPNYRGPRPHRLAAIDVRQAPSEDAALAAVERNASDLILDAHHAVVVPSRYRSRFIRYRAPIVRYLALNTRGKVFSDPKVRRAAGLALNRAALASLDPSLKPTETLLPPGFPGAAARTAFRTEGNLAAARRTAGRLRARAVYLTCDSSSCIKQATLVARQLAPIGIKVVIKKLPVGVLFSAQWKRGVTWDITDAGWAMDYVDPADFLVPLATAAAIKPPPRGANVARFTDPSIEQMFARARALHGAARARAFANIEWTLRAKDVPYIAIANDTIPVLFSARTGCRVSSPVYGVDLAALCIRRRSP